MTGFVVSVRNRGDRSLPSSFPPGCVQLPGSCCFPEPILPQETSIEVREAGAGFGGSPRQMERKMALVRNNKRKLGNSGLEVTPLAFGGNVFGWTVEEARSLQLLDAFAAAGFDFIDTADVYSKWKPGNQGGESETIIGKWMKQRGNRANMVIATKVGMELSPEKKGLGKDYIFRSVEDSLKRLQTDYIDLYFAHQDDPATPLAETLEAFSQLIKSGKVRAIGASNYTADRLAEALKISGQNSWPRYEVLQPLYNLYDRAVYEDQLEPLCLRENIGVITYFSLASGFLSGKYRAKEDLPKHARGSRVEKYLNDRGLRILNALDEVARSRNATPSKVAIAWLMARPSVTAPIASATSLEQLRELVDATRLELSSEDIQKLQEASSETRSASA
jgi:aryl-alcohol dehydrogenase-like predicted oxidoreductase